jgi:hypothetical protein
MKRKTIIVNGISFPANTPNEEIEKILEDQYKNWTKRTGIQLEELIEELWG